MTQEDLLNPYPALRRIKIEGATRTDRGRVRRINEDAVVADGLLTLSDTRHTWRQSWDRHEPYRELVMVLDGMGGHQGGAVASRLAGILAGMGLAAATDEAQIGAVLASASQTLALLGNGLEQLRGLGCTAVGVLVDGQHITIFNVGDSRAYRYVDGSFGQLSIDDRGVSAGGGSVLTQALGRPRGDLDAHVSSYEVLSWQRLLVCSDGLYDYVDQRSIKASMSAPSVAEVAESLVDAALAVGAPDNVSVVVLEVETSPDADS